MKKPSMSPQDMMSVLVDSMQERTGRTLPEWVVLVQSSGIDPLDQNAVRRWLKSEQGVPQNSQWAIADAAARAAGWERPSVEEYIDHQYAGPKAALRPIFDRVREIVEAFGEDVTLEGRTTYTSFVRRRQFMAVAAATRDRIDIGLRYTKPPASKFLVVAKAPGQATHKLSLTSLDQITSQIERLLWASYDQNG
jgi:hypothetical protein